MQGLITGWRRAFHSLARFADAYSMLCILYQFGVSLPRPQNEVLLRPSMCLILRVLAKGRRRKQALAEQAHKVAQQEKNQPLAHAGNREK